MSYNKSQPNTSYLPTLQARFESKYVRGKPDECWLWQASTRGSSMNYGQVRTTRHRMEKAHRAAWLLANGPIPKGKCVLHTCDQPLCVNPAHLWLGTKGEKNTDRDSKNRSYNGNQKGENNNQSKYTNAEIREMRAMYPSLTQHEIGELYECSQAYVSNIVNMKTRRDA